MPFIQFPNIPALPGVPDLPRLPSLPSINTVTQSIIGLAEGAIFGAVTSKSQWGIYDKAGKALGDPAKVGGVIGGALSALGVPTGVLSSVGIGAINSNFSTDHKKETRVSDFPVEKGSFASYNKVEMPGAPVVVLCFTGSEKEGTAFLAAIDKACKSTDLYDVVTPTATYKQHSVESYNLSRTAQAGATLLKVQLMLKEIRQVESQYTQAGKTQIDAPKSVSSALQIDAGKIQAAIPGVSTLKSAVDKVGSFIKNPLGSLGF